MKKLRREYQEVSTLLNDIPAWVLALFTASCIAMNLLANKSIDLNFTWLALDSGILVSWVAFFSMDIIVKKYGAKASITVSVIALAINLLFSVLFIIASRIPGTWGETYASLSPEATNIALDNTFAGTWYVLLGSSIAFLLSTVVNSVLNMWIGRCMRKDNFTTFAIRSYASTFVGQFVDNFTFAMIVSLNFFGWSLTQCVTCSLFGAIAELIMESIFSPIGYKITKKWTERNIGHRYRVLCGLDKNATSVVEG